MSDDPTPISLTAQLDAVSLAAIRAMQKKPYPMRDSERRLWCERLQAAVETLRLLERGREEGRRR